MFYGNLRQSGEHLYATILLDEYIDLLGYQKLYIFLVKCFRFLSDISSFRMFFGRILGFDAILVLETSREFCG